MGRKELRDAAKKQGLDLTFDFLFPVVVARRKDGTIAHSGPIYELEARLVAGELI